MEKGHQSTQLFYIHVNTPKRLEGYETKSVRTKKSSLSQTTLIISTRQA